MQTTTSPSDIIRVAIARRLCASGEAKRLRERQQLSGPEVAAAVGVSSAALWRWEHGQRQPQGDAAARYADLLQEMAAQEAAV